MKLKWNFWKPAIYSTCAKDVNVLSQMAVKVKHPPKALRNTQSGASVDCVVPLEKYMCVTKIQLLKGSSLDNFALVHNLDTYHMPLTIPY